MYSDPDILSEKVPQTDGGQFIVLSEVLEVLGRRSFVPFIAIPAIFGAFPGNTSVVVAAVCGVIIALVAFQMLAGYQFLQLPGVLRQRYSETKLAQSVTSGVIETNNWLDRVLTQKMMWLQTRAFAILPNIILLLVGLSLPFLVRTGQPIYLICISILIYCVSIMIRDGRFLILSALVLSAASVQIVL